MASTINSEKQGAEFMEIYKNISIEYIVSKHILKKLLAEGKITDEEFKRIDEENRKTFNRK